MRYPDFLKEKGQIGFIAPSFGCNTEPYRSAFQNALRKFKELGYRVILGPNCYAGEGIGKSNTPEKCAAELNSFYCEQPCEILISCGGGELMCEDIPYFNFERISSVRPKWYMGYSDNTNFTFLQTTLCDTAAVYGPCASSFGMEPWHQSIQDAFDLLTGKKLKFSSYDGFEKESFKTEDNPLVPYNITEAEHYEVFNGSAEGAGRIHGRLIGGCMDCLTNLVGTRFDKVKEFCERYADDGIVWFLEACELNVMGIRRALWQLEEAGWFKYVKGFVFGRAMMGGEMMGLNETDAVMGIVSKYNVPVIMNADIGHLPPMIPVISGALADIEFENGKLTIEYILR